MASNFSRPVNPNPPTFVTGAQIRAARALLGWRRVDLAAAAGLHRNAVAYWERQQRMPRSEPFACRKMRAALLSAGVVTVSTPAPGVCLLDAPFRAVGRTAGADFKRATSGHKLCAEHTPPAVSTAEELPARSVLSDCERGTDDSEAGT